MANNKLRSALSYWPTKTVANMLTLVKSSNNSVLERLTMAEGVGKGTRFVSVRITVRVMAISKAAGASSALTVSCVIARFQSPSTHSTWNRKMRKSASAGFARTLACNGFWVFRFDYSGVGESTGSFAEQTSEACLTAFEAAVDCAAGLDCQDIIDQANQVNVDAYPCRPELEITDQICTGE